MADTHSRGTRTVSRLLADIRLRLLGSFRWKARAARVGRMKVKSEISRPSVYEILGANQVYTIFGAAWAGETEVTEIAVSTDDAQTWANAQFLDPIQRRAWRRWKFDWLTPKKPGRYTLIARAK